jgi:hypothetical protein
MSLLPEGASRAARESRMMVEIAWLYFCFPD